MTSIRASRQYNIGRAIAGPLLTAIAAVALLFLFASVVSLGPYLPADVPGPMADPASWLGSGA